MCFLNNIACVCTFFFFYKFSSEFIDIIVGKDQIIKLFIDDNFMFSVVIATITIIIATSLMCPMSPFIILIGFFFTIFTQLFL